MILKHATLTTLSAATLWLSSTWCLSQEPDATTDESPPAPLPPAIAREKVIQWVETKKLINQETEKWAAEKVMLTDLIELRQREASEMDKVIDLAKERVDGIAEQSTSLEEEMNTRRAWRENFEKRVTALEDALIPQLAYIPDPVQDKIFEAVDRLKDRNDGGDLQGRFRDVLAILNECIAFNSKLHSAPEVREIDGEEIEVDVLYLGMNQAWWVDREGRRAGIGLPTADGWVWQSRPAIAAEVRRTVDIYTKKEAPAFTTLPIATQASK